MTHNRKTTYIAWLLPLLAFVGSYTILRCEKQSLGKDIADGVDTTIIATNGQYSDRYDQRQTEACWIFAMAACIEHEAARAGDDVKLSRQWLMSHYMLEQALRKKGLRAGGKMLTMRGVGGDVLRLIDYYGLVPYASERSSITNSRVLGRKLDIMAGYRQWDEAVLRAMLPRFTVTNYTMDQPSEATFYYQSALYTARQFAESIMYRQQWHFYHIPHPAEDYAVGEMSLYDVRDNIRGQLYINATLRPDSTARQALNRARAAGARLTPYSASAPSHLLALVKASLREGHPVYWEYGREASQYKDGSGVESDHAMAIVGMRNGKFLCLNSYGKHWGLGGYCLVSEDYFLRHTSSVGVVGCGL